MGDEIRGEVGDDSGNAAFGKKNQQTTSTGGGATVHLQGNSDTLSNIFYHLSSINAEMKSLSSKLERFGDKVDSHDARLGGHDTRISALEGRVTRIESGRPVEISNRDMWYIAIIAGLIAFVGYLLLNNARGGDLALLTLTQNAGAVYMFTAAAYQNLRTVFSWI